MIGVRISNIITPAILNAGQIDNTSVADDSISTPKVQNSAITDDKILNGTILGQSIAAGTLGTSLYALGSVTGAVLGGSAVSTDKIASLAVTASKMAFGTGPDQVNTDEIPEGSTNLFHTDARAISAVENEATLDLSGTVTVTGNTADKTTTIGDYDALGLYDSTGIQVQGDDTSWAGISLVEYEGGASKPVPNFANPFFNTEVWGGTPSTPAAVSSGKRLFAMSGAGSIDNGGTIEQPASAPARFIIETTETQTTSGRGTKMYIQTTPTGSTTRSTTATFQGDNTTLINLIASGTVVLSNLPTSDPGNPGQLWNDGGTLKVS